MGRLFLVNGWMEGFGFGGRLVVSDCQGLLGVRRKVEVERNRKVLKQSGLQKGEGKG
jgi:hypothetical protein